MSEQNNIPKHWQVKNLEDLLDYIQPTKFIVKSSDYSWDYITPVLTAGKTFILGKTNEKEGIFNSLPVIIFDDFTTAIKFVNFSFKVKSSAMKILKPRNENVNIKFVYYYMQTIKVSTDTHKRYWISVFSKQPIPLPPLHEQQAIVSKIEELLSDLENGKQQLLTAQQQLKVYRQSLLKAAFEGKLTKTISAWRNVKLGDIANAIDPQPSHRTPPIAQNGIPYVSIKDFDADADKIDFTNARKVSYEVLKEHLNRYKLEIGDFVIGKIGTIGKPVRIVLPQDYTLSANIVLIQPRMVNPTYLYYYFQSTFIEKAFTAGMNATTQAAFGIQKVRELRIELPNEKEQQLIVDELESKLTVCDKIEETITQSLQQAEMLKQSILKRAFEGRLVTTQNEIPIYKPRNEYFYQMQVLALIAKTSKQEKVQHGEMTLAKYAYLLDRVYNIPTYYEYNRWHLGPYPPQIKKAINNKKFFKKTENHIEVINEETLFGYSNHFHKEIVEAISDLTNIFSKYAVKERSYKTELLATVCKVVEDIQSVDLHAVRKSMMEWKIELDNKPFCNKAEKFSEQETEKCLQFISEKGWDKKIIKQNEYR